MHGYLHVIEPETETLIKVKTNLLTVFHMLNDIIISVSVDYYQSRFYFRLVSIFMTIINLGNAFIMFTSQFRSWLR